MLSMVVRRFIYFRRETCETTTGIACHTIVPKSRPDKLEIGDARHNAARRMRCEARE